MAVTKKPTFLLLNYSMLLTLGNRISGFRHLSRGSPDVTRIPFYNNTPIVDFHPENNASWTFNTTMFSLGVPGLRHKSPYSVSEIILIAIVAGLLSLGTVVGNVVVVISIKLDKQLQTISNYFLLSLAVADLWIGLVSMPLFTMYTLLGVWPLGSVICDTWLALDYLNSNASVLNLLIISFDRYFSVTRPLTYRAKRTTKRAAFMITCAWVISLVLWPPWIYSWPYIEGQRKVAEDKCFIQFLETNLYITFGTAIAAFYLPVTVMCILYWRIWKETEQRKKNLTHLQAGKKDDSMKSSSSDSPAEGDQGQRSRSESCMAIRACEATYVPTSLCVEPPKQQLARVKSRPQKVREALKSWCKIDRDPVGLYDDCSSHESLGAITPASAETPIQSSGTTSITFHSKLRSCRHQQEEGTVLTGQDSSRKNDSSTHPSSISSDPIYTILIRLPTEPPREEGESQASVKMVIEEEKKEIEFGMQPTRVSQCLEGLTTRRPTNVGLRLDTFCSSEPTLERIRLPLNTKLIHKQVAKHKAPKKKRKQQERKQEKKAARTLSAILLAFIVTWTPYNVLVLVKTLLPCVDEGCIPEGLWGFAYYLCYINSTINPLCYALCNTTFRRTYIRILLCKWHNKKVNMANRGYFS
ncbi:muscarinic acetylcholine receptor DM1-like [Tachypleus tridentatus]|uniref:muscarinic acetylcholine receptor DM1-like n=1 Tax=Tachypleus tridentatus TaxID=6853 RepID=UPI003FCF205C